ncbi:MAG TPA: NPCBM/NEW2 domain-containing protein, partial [Blastocatellia bacterium]|nr:NPCBM/NEW2 domain-containing protein [Blastocatellia bacterium]
MNSRLTRVILMPLTVVALLTPPGLLMGAGRARQIQDDFQKSTPPPGAIFLDSLDVSKATQEQGKPVPGKSSDNNEITIAGMHYQHGVGMLANAELTIQLNGCAKTFAARVGVDDETRGRGSVAFEVWADDRPLVRTRWVKGREAAMMIDADLTGAKTMTLVVTGGGYGRSWDHADWAGAMIFLAPDSQFHPVTVLRPDEPAPPIKPDRSLKPEINGPRITGATPGRPFLFLIPAIGQRPLRFMATGLPEGLVLDRRTGIVSGKLEEAGEYKVLVKVSNRLGSTSRELTIVGGEHKLALTPPMGWNSWNVWAQAVDQEKV